MITTTRCVCILAFAAITAACDPAPSHSTAEQTSAALDLITTQRLKSHVAFLADDALMGREVGEIGYDRAAEYVATELGNMGVVPAGVGGWFQPVALRSYRLAESGSHVTIHRNEHSEELTYREDYSMAADAVRESTSIRAEVVYVGYGVHAPEFAYSDYDGIDVDGKIIAAFRGAPEIIEGPEGAYYSSSATKYEEAVARGAVGLIGLRSHESEKRRAWDEIKNRFGKRPGIAWTSDDGRAANFYPQLRGSTALSLAASERLFGFSPLSFEDAHQAMLASTAASAALGIEVTLSAQSIHTTVSSANVVGMVRGTDPLLANEFVVYTAHLDHLGVSTLDDEDDNILNGMYDNAMGVALMLETARAIAAAPPKRSVLFIALTAEESGLLGSDYFVNNPTVALDAIVANINLDMPLFLYPVADLVAFGSQHSSLHSVVEASAAAEGFVFSPDPVPEERLFVRSDQYSFVRKGIPAFFLVTGFNSTDPDIDSEALYREHLENHYHEASDDMTRPIHWDSALRFARAHTRMGQVIGSDADRPRWNEGDFFGRRFAGQ